MLKKAFDPNKMKNSDSSNIELRISILKTWYAVIFWMPRKGFEHNSMKNIYSPNN